MDRASKNTFDCASATFRLHAATSTVECKPSIKKSKPMQIPLAVGALLLALSATVATASATPVPFVDTTPGFTTFTAPSTGTYDIVAFGAQGGNSGGLGAEIGGDFVLTAGETLTVAVGGSGGDGTIVPILSGGHAIGSYSGGGGGGTCCTGSGAGGHFIASNGGGGYSGGAGGYGAGGGGSFDAGLIDPNLLLVGGVNSGNDFVTITELTTVPEPASLTVLGTGLAGLLALRRRGR